MTLFAVRGDAREVNKYLLERAIDSAPAIFIDTANCANIHKIPFASDEQCGQLYVLAAESLYRYKPTLLRLSYYSKIINTKNIFISAATHLFNYDDKEEDADIFAQCWAVINWLSTKYQVTIGVVPGTIHEDLAKKYNAKMGHTITSQRIYSDSLINELKQFAKALREEDRTAYSGLLDRPLRYLGSISYVSSRQTWAFLLLAIVLEQEKRIRKLEHERLDS